MRLLTITAFTQGLANLGLALYLGKKLGLGGITLALVIVVLPQTYLLWRKIGRFFEFSPAAFLSLSILRCVLPLAAASALSLVVHHFVNIRHKHLLPFFAEALVFIFVYSLLAYRFSMVEQDKGDVDRYVGAFAQRIGSMFGRGEPG
jgi:peptidoglycan biosynthesis protein MviN/MurJ (putative lipid II flippase)